MLILIRGNSHVCWKDIILTPLRSKYSLRPFSYACIFMCVQGTHALVYRIQRTALGAILQLFPPTLDTVSLTEPSALSSRPGYWSMGIWLTLPPSELGIVCCRGNPARHQGNGPGSVHRQVTWPWRGNACWGCIYRHSLVMHSTMAFTIDTFLSCVMVPKNCSNSCVWVHVEVRYWHHLTSSVSPNPCYSF